MTKYLKKEEIDNSTILEIANALKEGKLVVFPTDTVYGIGTNVYNKEACQRIYEVKRRPKYKPLSVLISDMSMLKEMVDNISTAEQKLIDAFWPGPLTILFKKKDGVLPNVVSEYIGVRLIDESLVHKLIKTSGVPIVAPSANISGSPTGTKIENIVNELGGKVDYILDCGDIENDTVSTIVQVEEEKVIVIREGKIKKETLAKVIDIIDRTEKKGIQIKNDLINIENIYQDIRNKIITARQKIFKHMDTTMMEVYWYVGKITYELSENSTKAHYGKKVIEVLSSKLTCEFGSGFSPVSIRRMRKFYETYPIWSTVSTELSWAHYQELVRIDRKEEREFYEDEAIKSNWGVRELRRQIGTKLYERYLISPDKDMIMKASKNGFIEKTPEEILKSPYIFEFAGLKENKNYLETDLESALLSHLTEFLLELGTGFSFVASQQRIKIGSEYYYPDLIFYNRLAKCFVIIDLKIGKLTHQDIGQMQMYVNYYKRTQMIDGENEPIGILLCADKDDAVVEMTLGDDVKNVYASKYLTYLPTKEELIKIIKDEKELYELANEEKVGENNE